MKTLIISTSKFGSPVSDYYKTLAQEFVKDNFNVIFIFDGRTEQIPVNEKNIVYYTWPTKRPTKLTDFIFLFKIVKKHKPFLCISNFGSTNVMAIVSFLLNVENRINYVHTTISQLKMDSNSHFLKYKFLFYRKKMIYSLCTRLFTNSEGTKNDIWSNYSINKSKISVFPLLLKRSKKKRILNFEERRKEILIIGRLHHSKGHEVLIKQFKACLEKGLDLKLKIIGSGNLQSNLEKLVVDLDIESRVSFLGNIINIEIYKEYRSSLIHISSSVEEAYGLVNIEALREGTPIISTRTFGAKDILKEGYNGEYFSHEDNFSLFLSISKILKNWETYSRNSLQNFNEEYLIDFNIERHKNRILTLLKEA